MTEGGGRRGYRVTLKFQRSTSNIQGNGGGQQRGRYTRVSFAGRISLRLAPARPGRALPVFPPFDNGGDEVLILKLSAQRKGATSPRPSPPLRGGEGEEPRSSAFICGYRLVLEGCAV